MPALTQAYHAEDEGLCAILSDFCKYEAYKIIDANGEDRGVYKVDMYLWYVISICFMYVNNSINFYLYCLGGPTFRKEFIILMSCFKPRCCNR